MAIERKSIDYVAENERHGRVIDQGTFWFLGNFHFFTIAIGFVGPSMGLGFAYTSLAGALGSGCTFIAKGIQQLPHIVPDTGERPEQDAIVQSDV